jgi:hypothetical protein
MGQFILNTIYCIYVYEYIIWYQSVDYNPEIIYKAHGECCGSFSISANNICSSVNNTADTVLGHIYFPSFSLYEGIFQIQIK